MVFLMVLRPLYTSGQPHGRFSVDPAMTCEAGQVGQLSTDMVGNTIVTLAGSKPLGLIADDKTAAFTQPILGEVHTVMTLPNATWLSNNANLVSGSQLVFLLSATGVATAVASPGDYTVTSYTNGLFNVTAAGAIATASPYIDTNGDGIPDSVNVVIQYQFAVPGVAGTDTTLGSGLVTLWFQRGEFSVSVYDTATTYAVNTKLYVGDGVGSNAPLGTLTVAARTGNAQVVGAVSQPPTASNPLLSLITDFDIGSWV
jgi:hypothetical protein